MKGHQRLLFIPASGPKGSGEYFRSLNIARTLQGAFHQAEVRFILNRQSPFAGTCPFPVYEIDDIPTRSVARVNEIIADFMPNLVLFDATGRSSQLKAAKKCGAKTVFIAQNRAILNRAFGLNRLTVTDEVWIVQPDYLLKPGFYNKLKLKFSAVGCYQVGPVYPRLSNSRAAELQQQAGLTEPYIIINPGGGGHMINGEPVAVRFEACARRLAQSRDEQVILVYGPNYRGERLEEPGITVKEQMEADTFQAAIMGAAAFLSGGGGALFQAVDAGIPAVGVSLSPDQSFRIERMNSRGLIARSKLDPEEMESAVSGVLENPPPGLMNNITGTHALDRIEKRVKALLNTE